MEKLGTKIFLTNDIEEYTDNELKELQNLIATEINKRQDLKRQEDWANLVEAFREYDSKYGIVFEDSESGEEYIMISADENECDRFYFN